MRPNIAPAAGILLAGAGLAALAQRHFRRVAGLVVGFAAVLGMALHNLVYGGVLVLFTTTAELPRLLLMPPSAYFAALAPPNASKPDDNPDLSQKGAQAAVGRRCASCHTDTFAGTKAVARVAGQREEYLLKALHDYKSGVRSGGGMAAMAEVAYPLSEEEITALAHYLAHL